MRNAKHKVVYQFVPSETTLQNLMTGLVIHQ